MMQCNEIALLLNDTYKKSQGFLLFKPTGLTVPILSVVYS